MQELICYWCAGKFSDPENKCKYIENDHNKPFVFPLCFDCFSKCTTCDKFVDKFEKVKCEGCNQGDFCIYCSLNYLDANDRCQDCQTKCYMCFDYLNKDELENFKNGKYFCNHCFQIQPISKNEIFI